MAVTHTKVRWYGDKVKAKIRNHLERNLDAAAVFLTNAVRDLISKGRPASGSWEPPHVQTGHLRRNVGWNRIAGLLRRIGTGIGGKLSVGYAYWLEYGTRKMLPRPFMRPSLYSARADLKRLISTPMP